MSHSLLQSCCLRKRLVCIVVFLSLAACQSQPKVEIDSNTLKDLDIVGGQDPDAQIFVKPKSTEEIRQAYIDYLNQAVTDEEIRLNALTRLAELEYDDSIQFVDDTNADEADTEDSVQFQLYQQRLQRSIDLLSTSLTDFPDAKGNDTLLYQLAKAQAQVGQNNASVESLDRLVGKYPKSPYYAEAQFRIAENAFSAQNYSAAEYAYSEVILASNNEIFYEKSLFKRGWAQFKQEFYSDSIDNFIAAVLHHQFDEFELLTAADQEQFNEYFRAIALAFSHQKDSATELVEYFKNRPGFPYTYHTYRMIGDLYLRQERYSDAVNTHQQFIENFSTSDNIPYSYLKIIEIWKDSGFEQQIYQAIEDYYVNYNPGSSYWISQNENSKINRVIRRSLREYLVLMTAYNHNRFQASGNAVDLNNADKWYQRYLTYYDAYARQDNIYFLYGELLAEIDQPEKALGFYEKAGFDNTLILHKEAVYASIVISDGLYVSTSEPTYLDKSLDYTRHFTREYPTDARSQKLARRAAEQAYLANNYRATIELADLALASGAAATDSNLQELRGTAYFELREYETAESIFWQMLQADKLSSKKQTEYQNNLALSIYRQGEKSRADKDTARAIHHFSRISTRAPGSRFAATGLYDAIALNMQNQQWTEAIDLIESFQRVYPQHELSADVSRKLSVAYLSSDQGIKAAREFEKLASLDSDYEVKAAALWKAAELYEAENRPDDAIKAYRNYAAKFKKPYTQMLEAMYKVASLSAQKNSFKTSRSWYTKILQTDEEALNNVRSDRSRYITSAAYLELARHQKSMFDSIKLTLPLKVSLNKKRKAMKNSIVLFGKASENRVYEITTESTYNIAMIYRDFSQAMLNSERPGDLNEDELDQYEILLEDQVFNFEDKSIEFFEINLSRISKGLYDDWIDKSHAELRELYPVRYDRPLKFDDYISTFE